MTRAARAAVRSWLSAIVVVGLAGACGGGGGSSLALELEPATVTLPADGRWATVALTVSGAAAERPTLAVEGLPAWVLADHPARYAGTGPVTLWFRLEQAPPAGVPHLDARVVAQGSTRAEASLRIVLEAPVEEADPDPPLSAEQVAFLDSVPTSHPRADEIVFPNGVTIADYERANRPGVGAMATGAGCSPDLATLQGFSPQKQKDQIICAMLRRALELTAPRSFPAGDGPHAPAQTRIGYVFGAKQYAARSSAVTVGDRVAGCAYLRLHGLDCSGFVKQLVDATPLTGFPVGTAHLQASPDTWKALFERNGLDGLDVERVETTDPRKLESGDIIFWRGSSGLVRHIGVVVDAGPGGLSVAQSNGGRDPDPDRPCEANFTSPTRGARFMSFAEKHWFGSGGSPGPMGQWEALRITAEPDGNYAMYGKCDYMAEPDHLFRIELAIGEREDGRVTGRGQGVDVDGKLLEVSLSADYERQTATLSGTIRTQSPGLPGARYDIFSARLIGEDTGYVPTTLVSLDPPLPPDSVCAAVARFVRLPDE